MEKVARNAPGSPLRAVRTTGIYCRPGCAARPNESNVEEFPLAAAAEAAGYRACHRCRPYREADPGAIGPAIVCSAVRLVTQGVLDDHSEGDLAARLGISARHLRRVFVEHLGVTPDRLARSHRAHFARRLLDDSDLPIRDVAFASGFGSVRQMQREMTSTFGEPPSALRSRRIRGAPAADHTPEVGLTLALPHRGPLAWDAMARWLGMRTVEGVEAIDPPGHRAAPGQGATPTMRRALELDGEAGLVELTADPPHGQMVLTVHLPRWDDLIHVARAARRVAATESPWAEAVEHLSADPVLGDLVAAEPGLRPPGCWDPFATVVAAVVAQQVTTTAARTMTARLARRHGTPVAGLEHLGLDLAFPGPEVVAEADLSGIGLTRRRAATLRAVAVAVADGSLDLEDPLALAEDAHGTSGLTERLQSISGIGPWTAAYIGLRMGAPDAFGSGDLALQSALGRLTHGDRVGARELEALSQRWRPFRSWAAIHLWRSLWDPAQPEVQKSRVK